MPLVIQEATLSDALEISKVAMETFPLACPKEADVNEINTYTEKNLSLDYFQKQITAQNSYVICAFVNDELAGFVLLIFGSACPNNLALEKPAELQKFYVKSKFHGTKVSNQLMNEAKKFYAKFNFVVVGTKNFTMENELHIDNLMVAKIT